MTAWVDADEFGNGEVPELPDEQRPFYVATAAIIIASSLSSPCCSWPEAARACLPRRATGHGVAGSRYSA